jgi:hypothetical protein
VEALTRLPGTAMHHHQPLHVQPLEIPLVVMVRLHLHSFLVEMLKTHLKLGTLLAVLVDGMQHFPSVQLLGQETVEHGDQVHQETVLPSMHQSATLLDLHHQPVSRLLLVMK